MAATEGTPKPLTPSPKWMKLMAEVVPVSQAHTQGRTVDDAAMRAAKEQQTAAMNLVSNQGKKVSPAQVGLSEDMDLAAEVEKNTNEQKATLQAIQKMSVADPVIQDHLKELYMINLRAEVPGADAARSRPTATGGGSAKDSRRTPGTRPSRAGRKGGGAGEVR